MCSSFCLYHSVSIEVFNKNASKKCEKVRGFAVDFRYMITKTACENDKNCAGLSRHKLSVLHSVSSSHSVQGVSKSMSTVGVAAAQQP